VAGEDECPKNGLAGLAAAGGLECRKLLPGDETCYANDRRPRSTAAYSKTTERPATSMPLIDAEGGGDPQCAPLQRAYVVDRGIESESGNHLVRDGLKGPCCSAVVPTPCSTSS
jgi:hypothetical protein